MDVKRKISDAGTWALQQLPPETAHEVAITALQYGVAPRFTDPDPVSLKTNVFGLNFPNPIGLAAGFDKNARAPNALLGFGFGFVEVGTITPLPQIGNPLPRLFRDPGSKALVNRLGFNGQGLEAALGRLETRERRGIVAANIGRNKLSPDGVADYVRCIQLLARHVDLLVANISSPNTPGLRDMQEAEALTKLVEASLRARDAARGNCPLLVKIAPDLDDESLAAIVDVALHQGVDGLIMGNTTLSRPAGLDQVFAKETGGLSGQPLKTLATDRLRATYRYAGGKIPLIGVGGVSSAQDAFEKIQAGASLVQLYTGFIYEGPAIVGDIKAGLARLLRENGFASVAQAVGTAA